LRTFEAIVVAAVCAALVVRQLGDVSLLTVAEEVRGIGAAQWLVALVATCASFAAAGQYDSLFHRRLGTGVRAARAGVSGAVAIALAQTLGFGLATGTIARWRALPELSLPNALRVTNYVSFTFMAEAARTEGVRRVSLAAMPLESGHPVLRRLTCRREAQGLRQFKCSFHPRRQTLYLAAPNLALLVLAGADILLRIAKPLPLLASKGLSSTMHPTQGGHSNMDVVSAVCRPHVGGNKRQMTQE